MSLETLNQRLNYHGGGKAEDRFINDKLKSLKKSLLYSYQAATAVLADGRKFRCLINTDKVSTDYDHKIISIPYKDICLNPHDDELAHRAYEPREGEEEIGLKCGDVFTWEETNTHWLVYLEHIEEDAYFRADIYKCETEVEIGDKKYWTYIRGPVETSIVWNQKAGVEWNDLNYTLVMYVKRDANTLENLKRFSKIKVTLPGTNKKQTWQVAAANPYHGDGIIEVMLDEYFENPLEDILDAKEKAKQNIKPVQKPRNQVYIDGPTEVAGYSHVEYSIKNISDRGTWYVRQNEHDYPQGSEDTLALDINKKSGTFTLYYKVGETIVATIDVVIKGF